jgi:hypothetical protein
MFLLIVFILLQAADVGTTYIGLRRGYDEASFIPASLIARFGFWRAVLGIKGIGLALCLIAMLFPAGWVFTAVLDCLGTAVLVHNYRILKGGNQ